MNIVTVSARKASRRVHGGANALRALAIAAHRANRHAVRATLAMVARGIDADLPEPRRVCGRDVS